MTPDWTTRATWALLALAATVLLYALAVVWPLAGAAAALVAIGFGGGWLAARAHHAALRVDRDLWEQTATAAQDAAHRGARHLERIVERPEIAERANRLAQRRWGA